MGARFHGKILRTLRKTEREKHMSDNTEKTDKISAIDQAIANAQARKAAKSSSGDQATGSSEGGEASKRAKLSDEEKARRQAERDAERAERKAKRDQEREERRAAKESEKKAPHMSKVVKAAAKLPPMSEAAQNTYNEITANLPAAQVAALAAHLQHFNRVSATERALNQKLEVGATVTIVSGEGRYVGKTGTVVKAQRIRCYVNIPGANNRPIPGSKELGIYFFTSDVQLVEEQAEELQAKAS